jgi:hypothetical protein
LTWNSSSAPRGVIATIASCRRSKLGSVGSSSRRMPTRLTWVSTGTSRMPKLKSSTHAAVLRPTPGSAVSSARASGTLIVSRWSSVTGSPMARRISWMRTDFCRCRPPGWIASSTSARGASRTASQEPKRSRRRRKATSRLRSFVDCDRTVRTSSSTGARCGGIDGMP